MEKIKRHPRTVDLEGQVFGKLTVVEFAGYKNHKALWLCLCECGNDKIILSDSLKSGKTKSCGCFGNPSANKRTADLTGQVFGKLTVVEFAGYRKRDDGRNRAYWTCECRCGNTIEINSRNLMSGNSACCGNCNPINIGDKFGKLVVIKSAGYGILPDGSKKKLWLCKCECGNITKIRDNNLKNNHPKSCGCVSNIATGGYNKELNLSYDSTWELNFAYILKYLEIEWKREPKKFKLSNGTRYIPDFYLPEFNMFIEIKGRWFPGSKEKTKLFKKEYPEYNYYVIDAKKYFQWQKEFNKQINK